MSLYEKIMVAIAIVSLIVDIMRLLHSWKNKDE